MQTITNHNDGEDMQVEDIVFSKINLLNMCIGSITLLVKSLIIAFAVKEYVEDFQLFATTVSVTLLLLINAHKFYPIGKKWIAEAIKKIKK